MAASEIREGYLHSHGIALQALGQAGNALLRSYPDDWRKRLSKLRKLDWSCGNARLWEGRALVGGKVGKGNTNVILTANAIKHVLGLPLDGDETKVEEAYARGFKAQGAPTFLEPASLADKPRIKEVIRSTA
jgi:DNA sulfur modification protein DndB